MVAITVILAAVIAAFVFGMGPPAKAPQASLAINSASSSTGNLSMNHNGGDPIDLNKVKAIIEQGSNRNIIAQLNATGAQIIYAGDNLVIHQGTTVAVYVNNAAVGSPTGSTANFSLASGQVIVSLFDTTSSQQVAKIIATVS